MARGRVGTCPGWALLLVALGTLCGVSGTHSPVTVQRAQDVVLPCIFHHIPGVKLHRLSITWKMQRAEGVDLLVHSYHAAMDQLQGQHEAYRGRTQLYPERFVEGNASLKLRDVCIQDEGSYICTVTSELGEWSEATLLMVLDSTIKLPIRIQHWKDVTLDCSFEPSSSLRPLNVTWQKKEAKGPDLLVHSFYNGKDQLEKQAEAYRGRTQLYPDVFSKGNASLRLRSIRFHDAGFYTCHVKPQLGRFTTQMQVIVKDSPSDHSPWIWLSLLFVLLFVLLFLSIIKNCRWKSPRQSPKLRSARNSPERDVGKEVGGAPKASSACSVT